MPIGFQISSLINAIVYAVLGVIVLLISFLIIDKLTPFHLWHEIVEKQNTAVAILAGFMALGISVIIASAVH